MVVHAGQTITLHWSPAGDLADHIPIIHFVADPSAPFGSSRPFLPVSVMGDQMTLALPMVTSPGRLEVTLRKAGPVIPPVGCMAATCELLETPQLVQPISWLSAPGR